MSYFWWGGVGVYEGHPPNPFVYHDFLQEKLLWFT